MYKITEIGKAITIFFVKNRADYWHAQCLPFNYKPSSWRIVKQERVDGNYIARRYAAIIELSKECLCSNVDGYLILEKKGFIGRVFLDECAKIHLLPYITLFDS